MLKAVVSAATLVFLSLGNAQAVEFVNKDGSDFSQLCIAAVKSADNFNQLSEDMGLSKKALKEVICNGDSLDKFAAKYKQDSSNETIKVVAFENANNAVESELCIAAATSNDAFEARVAELPKSINIRTVSCNGQSITAFAKRYNKSFRG